MSLSKINIEKPRYDQNAFEGRLKHFFATVNPLNVFATESELQNAKKIVDSFRNGTLDDKITEDELWKAKELYDSAYHPETGELMFIIGRMSFQVFGNMVISGCMLTFYRSTPAVIFWQFANQSFNAVVNYTNRNASANVSNEQLATAYAAASSASVFTAVSFNKLVQASPALNAGIIGRFVPFVAVAAANCVNIPLMRQQEIKEGIKIQTKDGEDAGLSGNAAIKAISQVVPSRVGMAVPGMVLVPILMNKIEKGAMFVKNPWLKAPVTILLSGICITFSTPFCCALFPQQAAIKLNELEPALQESVKTKFPGQDTFYFNKGL